ncbi:hypothetical protein [Cellulomonas sp.]|uniref:hypothetical protein n=1 Tax=Cellulomonas sp. TaxID=40001 RepID=UPI00281182DC|nr:hypothetical protein [Cellulomonas sp.]
MTVWDVLVTVRRHWLVSGLCLVLAAGGVLLAGERQESWNGNVTVLLLAPEGTRGNVLAGSTSSLVATTGVVVRAVTGPHDEPQTVSGDLTLTSIGHVAAWRVQQPSSGSQWERSYDTAEVDVRSSGPTLAEAQAQMVAALDRVHAELTRIQDLEQVDPSQRIRTELSPSEPVYLLQSGSRPRAMAAAAVLGVLGVVGAAFVAEAFAARRRARLDRRALALVA